ICAHSGLRRTYFADAQLTHPIGASEPGLPNPGYGAHWIPYPTGGKPFGAVFEGYISIPSEGRYRFFVLAQGNVRFSVANYMLFERWTGFEWRVTTEREMRFPQPGWYPIRLEFFTAVQSFPLDLALESAAQDKRTISVKEVCY